MNSKVREEGGGEKRRRGRRRRAKKCRYSPAAHGEDQSGAGISLQCMWRATLK